MKGKNFIYHGMEKLNSRKTKPSLYCVIKKNVNSPSNSKKKKKRKTDRLCFHCLWFALPPLVFFFSWWSGSYYTQPVPSFEVSIIDKFKRCILALCWEHQVYYIKFLLEFTELLYIGTIDLKFTNN